MKNRLRSMFIAAVLVGTVVAGSFTAPFSVQAAKKDTTSFEDLNQSQIVEAMGPGWNLGNQLESVTDNVPEETNWGNPVITEKLIQSVKAAGFKSIVSLYPILPKSTMTKIIRLTANGWIVYRKL